MKEHSYLQFFTFIPLAVFTVLNVGQVDKLEEAESRRIEETDHQEHKPMIMRK